MAHLAPWRLLLQNAIQSHSHLKHSKHLQLATVRPDGRPANRTLVFRGFVDDTNKMQFTTDSRSHKVEEIKHCPMGEICYYFSDSWEQFRIHGILDLIGDTESNPSKQLVDYYHSKENRRILFKISEKSADGSTVWSEEEVNP